MNTFRQAVLLCLLSAPVPFATAQAQDAATPADPAQQAMMQAWEKASTPGPQHQRLAEQMVGTWNTRTTMWMDPSAPPTSETGRAVNTAVLGGRHVRMDFTGQFMGQPFQGIGYSGYDNVSGKYVSSWMDNMSTGMYASQGDYDEATSTYTYRGEMPDPMVPGQMTPVREVVRVIDNDHHVMEWYETRDGQERKAMQIEFTRIE